MAFVIDLPKTLTYIHAYSRQSVLFDPISAMSVDKCMIGDFPGWKLFWLLKNITRRFVPLKRDMAFPGNMLYHLLPPVARTTTFPHAMHWSFRAFSLYVH